ncbi:MAG TPA: hypothetical protein VJB60_01240 [Candidatus Peribacterales bacterium]|nr:hypothetical protein [Candidatus Peribacterales bacterium]
MASILRRRDLLEDPEGSRTLGLSDDRADRFDYDSLESRISSVTINSEPVELRIGQLQRAAERGCAALQMEDRDLKDSSGDLMDKIR